MKSVHNKRLNGTAVFAVVTLLFISCSAQTILNPKKDGVIDTLEFFDSAHHWYDIKDTDKIIEPLNDQKHYSAFEYEKIADNILLYQKSNGGWPKNYDMQAVLTGEQKDAVAAAKNILNTCIDNGATISQLNYLAHAFSLSKIESYKNSFIKGIEYLLSAQYNNGGWPQFYPDTSGYRKYITYNDGAMIGVMKLLHKIVNHELEYNFVDAELYNKIVYSFNRGIDCILNTQISESDTLLAWCQQHNQVTYRPEGARTFEPASICNGESYEIVELLMSLKNPDKKIIKAIKSAVHWFEKSKIFGLRVQTVSAPYAEYTYRNSNNDRIVVKDSTAQPVWVRYYQLKTHVPIFCNRDGIIVYSLNEVERERRIGYAWYVYDPQKILDKYSDWLKGINED